MRRAQLTEFVTNLVTNTWTGEDADVAEAVLSDKDAVAALAFRLQDAGGSTPDGLTQAWNHVVSQLDDNQLDWMVNSADSPAGFLASRVG